MLFCSGCGEKIENGIMICPKCGKAVDGVSAGGLQQSQRNTLLFVSLIIGALFLLIFGIIMFAPIFPDSRNGWGLSVFANKSGFSLIADDLKGNSISALVLFLIIVIFLSGIAAVALNALAWMTNKVKTALAAAIAYSGFALLGLIVVIPAAPLVICFIAYGQLKKKTKTA